MLTGRKDTDILILEQMGDRDLFNYCLTNKTSAALCRDETFWRNRFLKKFSPEREALNLKPRNTSWKNYYMKTVVDTEKVENSISELERLIRYPHDYSDSALYILNEIANSIISKFEKYPTLDSLKTGARTELFPMVKGIFRSAVVDGGKALRNWANHGEILQIVNLITPGHWGDPSSRDVFLSGIIASFFTDILDEINKTEVTGKDILEVIRGDREFSLFFNF